ncbi:Receptor-like protein 12 [Triticum urartu]|uniref:Receptor-like protein 12 n=1 Tax=Triticum urartu TaxID=4572 RepID=M7ZW48_TRIUA|nr:Receptor-like protein 12 [Triticum urartu]
MAATSFLLLTIVLATASTTTSSSSVAINASGTSNGGCIPAERVALLSFKAGLTGDPDNRLISWQQGAHDCCRWSGVTCSRRTGHVIKLDLHQDIPEVYYLSDDDPENHSLRGQLSPSLLALRRLKYLDLSQNYLLGDAKAMPGFLGSLQSLTYLNLSNTDFHGLVPPQLGNLSNLVQLDIQGDIMGAGYQYSKDISWLARLRSLEHLNMGSIDLPEVVDWVHTVGALPNLAVLILFQCGLTNSNVPTSFLHHNLTVLEVVDLAGNQFSSPDTPNWLWNVTSLRSLRLVECGLSGTFANNLGNLTLLENFAFGLNNVDGMIPGALKKMCNLRSLDLSMNNISTDMKEYIDLSENYLEVIIDSHWVPPFNLESAWLSYCNLGPKFPKWLQWQKSIRELIIPNTGLVDRVPDWFWTTFSEATWLDISLNQLSGDLSFNLEFMSMTTLLMQSNLLTGLIPKLPSTIKVLDISRNFLNGFVADLGAQNLQVAALFSNAISGTIPTSICRLRKLRILDLSNNLLSKGLPDCGQEELKHQNPSGNNSSKFISLSSFSLNITVLLLSNNSFSSGFPLLLQQCPSLSFLDLTQNRFTGELPGWISEAMPGLVMLRLRSNNFYGHIPVEIMGLHNVRILDLSNNNFSGAIPQYIENLKALSSTETTIDNPFEEAYEGEYRSAHIGMVNVSITVVMKGQELEYGGNIVYLMSIDLSCNNLTGEIPEKLSSLVGLVSLNLSSNLLSGNIPYNIGKLQSVESLDFSRNKLGGEIPRSLSNLTYLSNLNLSYNNLSGRIPTGHQLDTLNTDNPASMYIGNPGLCGHPVPMQCPGPPRDPPTNGDPTRLPEDGLSQIDCLLGSIIGFVVGTWMVFFGLLFIKKWRYAYFGLLDNLYDRLYVISVVTWQKWFGPRV